jgi:hypothetical protein
VAVIVTVAIVSICMNLLLSLAMQELLGGLEHLQITTHMQMADIRPPANAQIFFEILLSMLTADVVDMDDFYDENFVLDEVDPFTTNFEMLGYGSYYPLKLLGTLAILMVAPLILSLLFIIVIYFDEDKVCRRIRKFNHNLYWNGFIVFIYENYILISLSALLGTQHLLIDTGGNTINSVITIVFWAILILFPIFIAVFYTLHYRFAWP